LKACMVMVLVCVMVLASYFVFRFARSNEEFEFREDVSCKRLLWSLRQGVVVQLLTCACRPQNSRIW
jgi:hypothetical protein